MMKTETLVMWLIVIGMILAGGCITIEVTDRPAQNTPKDYEEDSPQVIRDIKWGDTAKQVEAALGKPDVRGTNPSQQGMLKYNHGNKKGRIVFLFGPEQELFAPTRQGNRESDGLSKIIVMPDLTSAEHVNKITSEEPQTLPHISEAKGFLGDFLKSRGITLGNAPEAQTPE